MEIFSSLFNLVLILLGIAGLVLPIRWIIRVMEDKLARPGVAITGIIAHLVLLSGLSSIYPILGSIYCAVLLLVIGLYPYITGETDRQKTADTIEDDIEHYQRFIERRPENAAAHAALADIYRKTRRYDDAIVEYERAIALDPNHSREEVVKLEKVRREKLLLDQKNTKNDGKVKSEPTSQSTK